MEGGVEVIGSLVAYTASPLRLVAWSLPVRAVYPSS